MKKIIIPTDFSGNAFNALRYAAQLFQHEECEFLLLHTYAEDFYDSEDTISNDSLEQLKENLRSTSDKKLQKIEQEIKTVSPNPLHSFRSISAFGLLVDEVNDIVNDENVDLAIMGTRGKTNDREITFGSNTLQVVKYVQCPVLCVPEDFKNNLPQRILFPTDYLLPYQEREIKLVGDLARRYSANLHLLYISGFPANSLRQKDNQAKLKKDLEQVCVELHNRDSGSKENTITSFIEQKKIDLLVMVNSRHTYLESILSPSTVDKIGLHPRIPFLILQNFSRVNQQLQKKNIPISAKMQLRLDNSPIDPQLNSY